MPDNHLEKNPLPVFLDALTCLEQEVAGLLHFTNGGLDRGEGASGNDGQDTMFIPIWGISPSRVPDPYIPILRASQAKRTTFTNHPYCSPVTTLRP